MVIAKPQPIDAGGSNSSTNNSDDDEFTVTTHDDPFSGNTGGGKTGSEIIAEGGAPEAGVTNDPHETSVSEKFDDPKNAIDAVVDRAQDGDDGSSVNFDDFDATPANKQGKSDLKDSVESVVEATTSGGSNDSGGDVPSQAETAARNAANSVSQAVPDDITPTLSGGGGRVKAVLALLVGVALLLIGGS